MYTNIIMLHLQAPNNVIKYSIVGDGDAVGYFYVHPTEGRITLLRSVLDTGRSVYRVSIVNFSIGTKIKYDKLAC